MTPSLFPSSGAANEPRAIHSYCAAHRHDIPGVEKLDRRLEALDDYADWLEFDTTNMKRVTKLALGMAGGTALLIPLAFAAAPAIGGMIGSWGTLSGAAASSHGLALLGGGSIAAGGAGMFGGTVVVTATGATLGGALGTAVTAAYASADDSFSIELIEAGTGTPVVFVKGFLTDGDTENDDWIATIRRRYPDAPLYRVHWGAKELKALGMFAGRGLSEQAVKAAAMSLAAKATKEGAKRVGLIGNLMTIRGIAANPWTFAHQRAAMTGAMLADIIARTDEPRFVLVGHSLGARVVVTAAQALGHESTGPERVEAMHLFGAAVDASQDWKSLDAAVNDTVFNYWSRNDNVLKYAYRFGQVGDRAAGQVSIGSTYKKIRDRNVSRAVGSHSDYVANVTLQ